jgi:protein-tyrosine phosphatase
LSIKEFKYKVLNVLDMPFENIQRHFSAAIDFIKSAISSNGTVLVHWYLHHLKNFFSYAGISRSASVVIAYLMSEHNLPLFEALSLTRKRRPIIFPNPGFQK